MVRIVLKVGTGVLSTDTNSSPQQRIDQILGAILPSIDDKNQQLIIVSSGAIGIGKKRLGLSNEISLSEKQMCASIGQAHLIEYYQAGLYDYGYNAAQFLLTSSELSNPKTRSNLFSCLKTLEGRPIVPIVNENDVVSTAEIEPLEGSEAALFGDNDKLSSLLASEIEAEALVILMDGEGVFKEKPKTANEKPLNLITDLSDFDQVQVWKSSAQGRGGISSKIESVKLAAKNGVNVWVTSGFSTETVENFFKSFDEKSAPKNGTFVFGKDSQWKS